MNEPLQSLADKWASLPDLTMRVRDAVSFLSDIEDELLLRMLERLYVQAFSRAELRDALLVWSLALQEASMVERVFALRILSVDKGFTISPYLLQLNLKLHHLDSNEEERVPDYARSRAVTLGERKALARKIDRKMIEKVMKDPAPEVIDIVLANPTLTESDVVRMCARRSVSFEVLHRVFCHPRWIVKYRIKVSLALQSLLPLGFCTFLFPQLVRADRVRVIESRVFPEDLGEQLRLLNETPLNPF